LEKYCRARTNNKPVGPQTDILYDVLKERVERVLKEKGIDPIADRGASPLRTLYYLVILAAWVGTGYTHIMVRRSDIPHSFAEQDIYIA
jgi:hypothetical protein